MADIYNVLTWLSWVFMALFLIFGTISIIMENNSAKMTLLIITTIFSALVLSIEIVCFIFAVNMNHSYITNLFLIMVWLGATFSQVNRIINNISR